MRRFLTTGIVLPLMLAVPLFVAGSLSVSVSPASAAALDVDIPPGILVTAIPHPAAQDLITVPRAGTADAATRVTNPVRTETLLIAITDVFSPDGAIVTVAGRVRLEAGSIAGPPPGVTVSVNGGVNGSAAALLTRIAPREWVWSTILRDVVAGDRVTAAVAIQSVLRVQVTPSSGTTSSSSGSITSNSRPTTTAGSTVRRTPTTSVPRSTLTVPSTPITSTVPRSSRTTVSVSGTSRMSSPGTPSSAGSTDASGTAGSTAVVTGASTSVLGAGGGDLPGTGAGIPVAGVFWNGLALIVAGAAMTWLIRWPGGGSRRGRHTPD